MKISKVSCPLCFLNVRCINCWYHNHWSCWLKCVSLTPDLINHKQKTLFIVLYIELHSDVLKPLLENVVWRFLSWKIFRAGFTAPNLSLSLIMYYRAWAMEQKAWSQVVVSPHDTVTWCCQSSPSLIWKWFESWYCITSLTGLV